MQRDIDINTHTQIYIYIHMYGDIYSKEKSTVT